MLEEGCVGHCAQSQRVGVHIRVETREKLRITPLGGNGLVAAASRCVGAFPVRVLESPGDEAGGMDDALARETVPGGAEQLLQGGGISTVRLARIIDASRAIAPGIPVFYHSDGDCRAIVEDLVEIGVTILNPVQPECMDPAEMKRSYGSRLAFWGTIGIQGTLPFGTPAEVREASRRVLEALASAGGLILQDGNNIPPGSPLESINAMMEAAEAFGSPG